MCWLDCTDAQLIESLHDRRPPDRIGEKQYVSAAARARHLSGERAGVLGHVEALFDVRVRNAFGKLLLRLPPAFEDFGELYEVSLEERLLHGNRLILELMSRFELRRRTR